MPLPWKLAPAVPSVGTSTARASIPASFGLGEGLAGGGDLGVGEGDTGGADAFGDRLDLTAEHVLGGDPGLVLAHVGEEGAAVDVADGVEPLAATDTQPAVGLEEAVLAGLDAGRLEADPLGPRNAADRDQELLGFHPAAVVQLDRDSRAAGGDPLGEHAGAHVDPVGVAQRGGDLLAGEGLLARQQALLALDQGDRGPER